jgi:hypothetical protein
MRALITGGDSRIGRAVAIAYAREGADVAINYLPDEQTDADTTRHWIEAAGRVAVPVPGDLRTRDTCLRVVDDAVRGLGGLDILVNNAGYHWARGPEGLAGLDPDEMDRVLTTNLQNALWLCQAALGTSVVARASSTPVPCRPTSLQATHRLRRHRSGRQQLDRQPGRRSRPRRHPRQRRGPGRIWTPLQPATRPADYIETLGAHTPLGRAGQPAEVAPAFVFLASPSDASYVSGTVLGVTGGEPVF